MLKKWGTVSLDILNETWNISKVVKSEIVKKTDFRKKNFVKSEVGLIDVFLAYIDISNVPGI